MYEDEHHPEARLAISLVRNMVANASAKVLLFGLRLACYRPWSVLRRGDRVTISRPSLVTRCGPLAKAGSLFFIEPSLPPNRFAVALGAIQLAVMPS